MTVFPCRNKLRDLTVRRTADRHIVRETIMAGLKFLEPAEDYVQCTTPKADTKATLSPLHNRDVW